MATFFGFSFSGISLLLNSSRNFNGDNLGLGFAFLAFYAFVVSGVDSGAGWNADWNVDSSVRISSKIFVGNNLLLKLPKNVFLH